MRKLQRIVAATTTTTTPPKQQHYLVVSYRCCWKLAALVVLSATVLHVSHTTTTTMTSWPYKDADRDQRPQNDNSVQGTIEPKPPVGHPFDNNNSSSSSTAPMVIHLGTYRGKTLIAPPSQHADMVCIWQPHGDDGLDNCRKLLQRRVIEPLLHNNNNNAAPPPPVYMFGDSTMFRLYNSTSLRTRLSATASQQQQQQHHACTLRTTDWCNMTYGHPATLDVADYRKPDVTKEGPVTTGWHKPGCSDCGGCESHFLDCPTTTTTTSSTTSTIGGFVHMEFARDVEWQTELYSTTQENLAHLLLPDKHAICFVGAGLHDMIMPLHSRARFQRNVAWLVRLLVLEQHNVCQHVVWILNNAPLYEQHENYTQTVETVRDWNAAVVETFVHDTVLRPYVTIVDVFEAARYEHHCDNIHMGYPWYAALSQLVLLCVVG